MTSNAPDGTSPSASATLRTSVIICAFTLDRWTLLSQAVQSVVDQIRQPFEVFLVIDHNREMYEQCATMLPPLAAGCEWDLRVVENRFNTRLGGARTTAAELATGDVLVFLDDDASAEPTWLERIMKNYDASGVVAVGGPPVARYEASRPRWLPHECNWIFGCAYRGLPERRGPIDHLIGANMSIRRDVLISWGGFQSDNHDDMDMSHRAIHAYGGSSVIYDPTAIVHHFVPNSRLTWTYFWRRCFFVNKGKVAAFRGMGEASNLKAEFRFVARSLSRGLASEGRELMRGDLYAIARYAALVAAIALGGAGSLAGRFG